jgi:hypothetical protein
VSGPILPPIPMLSGGGSGKVLMVIGILVALAMVANQKKAAAEKAGVPA